MIQGDLARTRELAANAGLDALLALSSPNVGHLTGFAPANPNTTGVYWALLPVDPALPTVLTVGEFDLVWARERARVDEVRHTRLWIEIVDLDDFTSDRLEVTEKPVQFDLDAVVNGLRSALADRGLGQARVGIDEKRAPWPLVQRLRQQLTEVEFVAADGVYLEATTIKTEAEIRALRRATELTEVGIRAISEQDPRGATVSQLRNRFERAVLGHVASDPACEGYEQSRVYISAGGGIGPNLTRHEHVVTEGDVVWIDAGCQVDGYAADIGRTFSIGRASAEVRRIADALGAGSAAGFDILGPGVAVADIFHATQNAVRSSGLPTYTRGHVGHAVGIGIGERGPYLAPGNGAVLAPGMTMAYERPYYVRGLGGFQFEENFVVTDTGVEMFTSLPRGLVEL